MSAEPILHMALPEDWAAAQQEGEYRVSTRGRSLDEEGFIHGSRPDQLVGVANRFYADVDELILLHIDPTGLDVRVEPAVHGGTELFPHVYGSIPIAAVGITTVWSRTGNVWAAPPVTGDQGPENTPE